MSGIRKRNLTIGKLIGAPVQSSQPVERGTVIGVGSGTVDVRKGDGFIMRRVPLIGSAALNDAVQLEYKGGSVQALASGTGTSGGSSSGSNVAATGGTPITYTGAPNSASYLTLGADATLTSERVFTKGNGLTATDGGAGGAYTLSVGAGTGILSNSTDVAVNTAYSFTWSNPHTYTNGLYIGADVFLSRIGANILALGSGDSFQSQGFVSGVSGWQINYAGDIEANNILARGSFRASVFNVSEITSYAGTLFVGPSAGVLYEDFTSPSSVGGTGTLKAKNSDSGGSLFALGSRLRIKTFTGAGIGDSWLEVTGAITNNTTHTIYPVTLRSGSTSMAYKVGTGITDWGPSGSNIITASADGTIGAAANISLITHAGSPWSSQTLVSRWGNLTGVTDAFWTIPSGTNGIYTNSGYFNNVNIKGKLVIGPGVGFSVAPTLYCAYDVGDRSYFANTNGHLGQAATITGGVSGAPGKFRGGSVAISQNVSNRMPNPRFAHSTYNTGWTTGSNCTMTQANAADALYGSSAAKCVMSGTNNRYISGAITRSSTSVGVAVSAWVRCTSGQPASVKIGLFKSDLSASVVSSDFTVGYEWTLVHHIIPSGSISSWSTSNLVLIMNDTNSSDRTLIVGAVKSEENYFVTPYFDGSFGPGFSWAGTAHNSTSNQTDAGLSYPSPITGMAGTVSAWFRMSTASGGANADYRIIAHTSASNFLILRVNPSNALQGSWGSAQVSGGTVTAHTWNHALMTSDGVNMYLYLNGVQVATTSSIAAIAPGSLYVGALGSTDQWINGYIDDLWVSERFTTSDEVLALYNSNAPITVTRSNYELVLTDKGQGRVTANAGGIYGTSVSGSPNFTLLNSDQTVNGESLGEGDVLFGDNASGQNNLLFDRSAGELNFRYGGVKRVQITSAGTLNINDGGGNAVFTFDASTGAEFAKYLTLGASGGIYQGTGTSSSPTTGMRIRRSTVSDNGVIEFYNSSNRTMFLRGDTLIQINGGSAFASERAINFKDSSETDRIGELYGYSDDSTYRAIRLRAYSNANAEAAVAYVDASAENSTGTAYSYLWSSKFTSPSTYPQPTAYVESFINNNTPQARVVLGVRSKSGVSYATLSLDDNNGTQTWTATGVSKSWRIDHPLDPRNKWLDHYTVEGPGNYTFYKGRIVLDNKGHGVVKLPEYFAALNKNCSYQLTAIGAPAKDLHVSREVDGSISFEVSGGNPGQTVCWIISGDRADVWAIHHEAQVETAKVGEDVGKVAAWVEYGLTEEYGIKAHSGRPMQAGA